MPPASPAAMLALRIASSSDVLPWSTCPSIATTGGRTINFSSASSRLKLRHSGCGPSTSAGSGSGSGRRSSQPSSAPIICAVSWSMAWLMFASTPLVIRSLMISIGVVPSSPARSRTVRSGETSIIRGAFFVDVSSAIIRSPARLLNCWRSRRQLFHMLFQPLKVGVAQFAAQCAPDLVARQCALPAAGLSA